MSANSTDSNLDLEKFFDENFIMAADSNFFKVFDIAIAKGDPDKALLQPFDIVLTRETAERYFGEQEPIGKRLRIFGRDFSVSAICENVPRNSHMKFDFLFKWDDQFIANGQPNFTGFNSHIYTVLKPGADPALPPAVRPRRPRSCPYRCLPRQ